MTNELLEIKRRQIGKGHESALDAFSRNLNELLLPFIKLWIESGDQPLLSSKEISDLKGAVADLIQHTAPEDGYTSLPTLLTGLAEGLRFNRRNFVNIHPTPHLPSVLASLAVTLQNPNNIVAEVSRPTTALEAESVAWLAENLIGFDSSKAWGNIVSGGTVANMTALMVARDYCYRKLALPRPAEVRTRGLYGLPPGVVLATAGSHYSVRKALWFLGMGDENVISIPVAYDEYVERRDLRDENFIRGITNIEWSNLIHDSIESDRSKGAEEFEHFYAGGQRSFSLQPLNSQLLKALYSCFEYGTPLIAYVFTVGTTDTGTVERPDGEALKRLEAEDVYIHTDAAMGGFALVHDRVRRDVVGLDKVHSVTIDGHKFGQLPYPNGAVLFRERGWMYEILHEAPYLTNLAPTLEGSRPGSHVAALWTVIKDLGETGRFRVWFDRLFAFVDRLVAAFEAGGQYQILHKVDLTTMAVAPFPRGGESRRQVNDLVEKIYEQIKSDDSPGAYLVNLDRGLSGIKVKNSPNEKDLVDIYCLRIVATNPVVEPADADELVSYLEKQLFLARQ